MDIYSTKMPSTSLPLDEFLKSKKAGKGTAFTHTRIGDTEKKIYGGSYIINKAEEEQFLNIYHEHVFVNGNKEFLTEKQLIEDGPILIDIDLRYDVKISNRQHTDDHIIDLVMLYAEKCKELVKISENVSIEVFVMQKKDINKLDTKTKDGIHIIFGLSMHKGLQVMLRHKVLDEISEMWDDLPITNTWEDVIDEGVAKGFVNWQLYGSRKPGNQAYLINKHYTLTHVNDNWDIIENDINNFDTKKNIYKLSAHYTKHPKFDILDSVKDNFEKNCKGLTKKQQPTIKKKKLIVAPNYGNIKNEAELDELLEDMLNEDNIGPCNYKIKETHQYTMILPNSYYGPGSYSKWIRVGWALASTNPKLFLTWIKFSCQENCRDTLKGSNGKFDWNNIPQLYEMWETFCHTGTREDAHSVTYRSIMYWAKNDAKERYEKIRQQTIDYFIEQTVETATEFDLATVLYNMLKGQYVCVSIKNNHWYEYNGHRWFEIDSGNSLRLQVSKDMWQLYVEKLQEGTRNLQATEMEDPSYEMKRKKTAKLAEIAYLLKKTTWKNNIMREARELFYDQDFISKLDQNPYLLCFNNYIVDFKNNTYRRGQPDDYISKCTNIDYVPLEKIRLTNSKEISELTEFMDELFPDESLKNYMWEHLASCLVGTNENQTFNIYTGSGRNGKSKLVDLMSKCMGEYKGTVPITLITQKRNSIGSTSSEIVQLMGTRYAVMQEPSKGDKINEGIMKEITGGDPIQGRALFKDTITFIPQFKLVVCTNTDLAINSNDDGTWRRIRKCDFLSKFLENPYEDEDKFPKDLYPYQFKIDKNIDEKFNDWAPIFMSLLVDISFKNKGNVNDCPIVMSASDQYREGQDFITQFVKEMVIKSKGDKIKKTELSEQFKIWWAENQGRGGQPKNSELNDFMTIRYGTYRNGWQNVAINYDNDNDEDIPSFN